MSIEIRTHNSEVIRKEYPIEMVELKHLIPHEMTIGYELEKFKKSVIESNTLYWPLLVDRESKLVLDGHHRTKGLNELNYKNAPVVYIDYMDDNLISVDTWYPLVEIDVKLVLNELRKLSYEITRMDEVDFNLLTKREFTAIIGNSMERYQVKGDRDTIFNLIRTKWLDHIKYYDDKEGCLNAADNTHTAIVAWAYTKNEILAHVKRGKIFLPKTTRHFMKYEIMQCNLSLDKLEK